MQSVAPAKPRFPNAVGMSVARELCAALRPACERLIVAGSLRRRRPTIGDVEVLYIPKLEWCRDPGDFFASGQVNRADQVLDDLERRGILARRQNVNGSQIYGPNNKLMIHLATGLPVDLFAATEANWWNYLVCRTGPAESNIRIAAAAKARGWHWNPYGPGFTRRGEVAAMRSEQDVFAFVNLPYAEPWERV